MGVILPAVQPIDGICACVELLRRGAGSARPRDDGSGAGAAWASSVAFEIIRSTMADARAPRPSTAGGAIQVVSTRGSVAGLGPGSVGCSRPGPSARRHLPQRVDPVVALQEGVEVEQVVVVDRLALVDLGQLLREVPGHQAYARGDQQLDDARARPTSPRCDGRWGRRRSRTRRCWRCRRGPSRRHSSARHRRSRCSSPEWLPSAFCLPCSVPINRPPLADVEGSVGWPPLGTVDHDGDRGHPSIATPARPPHRVRPPRRPGRTPPRTPWRPSAWPFGSAPPRSRATSG